jgi:hypothetical protein
MSAPTVVSRLGECAENNIGAWVSLVAKEGFALLFAAFITSGCASLRSSDQADLFRRKHPEEAGGYIVLAPTSVAYIEYEEEDHYGGLDAIVKGVEKRKDDPVALAKYLKYLKCISVNPCVEPEWQSLRNRLRDGDKMYFFKYKRGAYDDYGLVVLRDGNVIYRSPWGTAIIQDSGGTNQPPANMTLDELGKP